MYPAKNGISGKNYIENYGISGKCICKYADLV